jgi:hypothetical protein
LPPVSACSIAVLRHLQIQDTSHIFPNTTVILSYLTIASTCQFAAEICDI